MIKVGGKRKLIFTLFLFLSMVFCLFIGYLSIGQTSVLANSVGDELYYAPKDVKSAGWAWDDILSVYTKPSGAIHVSFTETNYVDVRTTSSKGYQLDGLHLKFENFQGDGFGIAFSNIVSPVSDENAIRFFPCNVADNHYMRASYPTWSGLTNLGELTIYPIPSSFEISVNKKNDNWNFNIAGQTFTLSDNDVKSAITDFSNVYISFSGMGGSDFVNTFSFDYVSVHGGDSRCADTLTPAEQTQISNVSALIGEIGKVKFSNESLAKINDANNAFNNLIDELKPMITNVEELVFANQNYYVLGNPISFDENNIIHSFYSVTDNHLDTNDCTTFAEGSPQDRLNLVLDMVSNSNADGLVLVGDMTDWARFDDSLNLSKAKKQINMLKDSLDTYFAGDKSLFFTMGNHDSSESEGDSRVGLFREILGDDYYTADVNKTEEAWNKGYRHAKIAGFDYLSVEWNYANENQNISDDAINWLSTKLLAITNDNDYDGKPIFFVSHVPFNNTVDGSNTGAETLSKQKLFKVLEQYPQIIMLSGHSHYPISTEKFIYQDAITHVGVATTAYIGMDYGAGYLDDGGYHLSSNSYRPKDMLQAEGIQVEIDKEYNVRIKRIDFLKSGSQIWDAVIIPATDFENKTHLNYYSDARASRVQSPKYNETDKLEAKLINASQLELTFNTCLSEGIVQEYHIEIEGKNDSLFYKSFQANWRYINAEMVPMVKKALIDNFILEKPYVINVYAVDSFGNRSNPLTYTISDNLSEDKARAEQVDNLILAIGEVTSDNTKVKQAMEAYDKLSYDQKEFVKYKDLLLLLNQKFENLFKTIEEYRYGVNVKDTVLGQNYWKGGMMEYEDDEKGILIEYKDAVPNVRMGIKPYNLDGLHITFDKLEKKGGMESDPSIGIILGGTPHPQYTEPDKTGILLFFDTNIGKIEAHPGGQVICRGEELKYRNLKNKQFDIKFTALEDGGYKVECEGLVGKIDASYFDGSFSLKNISKTFVSLSNWVNQANFSIRLLSVHDSKDSCLGYDQVSISDIDGLEQTIRAINVIGDVTLDDESRIVYAEGLYNRLPEVLRQYVDNYSLLTSSRESLDVLKEQQKPLQPDEKEEEKNNKGETKKGCNSSMGTNSFFAILLALGIAIYIKTKKGVKR